MKKFTVIAIALAIFMAGTTSFAYSKEAGTDISAVAGAAQEQNVPKKDKTEKPDKVKNDKEEISDKVNAEDKEEIDDKENADDKENGKEEEKISKRKINKELLEQKKEERRQEKLETAAFVKEMKELFHAADAETRKEILAEIAEAKRELKDYSIGTFIKGIAVDFDKYDGVKPVIENNRTLAPLRAVSEAFGADVLWEADTETITVSKDETKIVMQIGEKKAYVNNEAVTIDAAPKIVNGRTLVPIRFIAEAFDLGVAWDADSQTVVVE